MIIILIEALGILGILSEITIHMNTTIAKDSIDIDAIKEFTVKTPIVNPKVSIIVPTYNSAQFLNKCLNSLIRQTLKEIEIIIVDDGSSDNTVNLCTQYASMDCRIKLVKQEHKKQGAARNNGTNSATGEYIGFVDSDDWVDEDYYEKLYNAAKKYNSDIALASNVRIGNGKTKKRLNIKKEEFVTNFQDKLDIGRQPTNPCPTNKIYRASMLKNNNIVWQEGVFCEDKLFTMQAVYYANGIVSVPDVYYYYYRNLTSTVNSKTKEHLEKLAEDKNNARRAVIEFLRQKNEKVRDKEFWAIKKDFKVKGFTLYQIKESTNTERLYLFGLIPIFEKSLN